MRVLKTTATLAVLLVASTQASAQSYGTVGEAVWHVLYDNLIYILGYAIIPVTALFGVALTARGLFVLTKAAGGQGSLSGAMGMVLAGSLLVAATEMAGVGMTSIFGQSVFLSSDQIQLNSLDAPNTNAQGFVSKVGYRAPQNCLVQTAPAACMAENIATNAVPVSVMATLFVAFITGFVFLGTRLKAMAAAGMDNGRTHVSPAQIALGLGVAALLMNSSGLLQIVSNTISGQTGTVSLKGSLDGGSSLLSYNSGLGDLFTQYDKLISNIFIILVFFGVWAFVRGLFILKKVADGENRDATVSHAMVFIVAGVLLANAKFSTCTIMQTITGGLGSLANVCQ